MTLRSSFEWKSGLSCTLVSMLAGTTWRSRLKGCARLEDEVKGPVERKRGGAMIWRLVGFIFFIFNIISNWSVQT